MLLPDHFSKIIDLLLAMRFFLLDGNERSVWMAANNSSKLRYHQYPSIAGKRDKKMKKSFLWPRARTIYLPSTMYVRRSVAQRQIRKECHGFIL